MLMQGMRSSVAAWTLVICCASGAIAQDAAEKAPAQDQDKPAPKADKPEVADLPGPPPIPEVKLGPTLPTHAIRRGAPEYNVQMVDASLLPRDRSGIWVLDFAFKPMRIVTVELPNKGRRNIYYLYYRVVNRTGKPIMFVPQFTFVTDTGKRYEDVVIPQAVKLIQAREDAAIPLLGAVNVLGVIPPSTKDGIDDAVYGVAIWDDIDPKADAFKIYVRGLSDGYQELPPPAGADKPAVRYKTLRIDFIRRGDALHINEKEIQILDPPYEWIYW